MSRMPHVRKTQWKIAEKENSMFCMLKMEIIYFERQGYLMTLLFICLLKDFWELFTDSETSPLLVKDYRLWPILGPYGHLAIRATPSETQASPLNLSSLRTHDTHTRCRPFGSGTVSICFQRHRSLPTSDRTSISLMQCARANTMQSQRFFALVKIYNALVH